MEDIKNEIKVYERVYREIIIDYYRSFEKAIKYIDRVDKKRMIGDVSEKLELKLLDLKSEASPTLIVYYELSKRYKNHIGLLLDCYSGSYDKFQNGIKKMLEKLGSNWKYYVKEIMGDIPKVGKKDTMCSIFHLLDRRGKGFLIENNLMLVNKYEFFKENIMLVNNEIPMLKHINRYKNIGIKTVDSIRLGIFEEVKIDKSYVGILKKSWKENKRYFKYWKKDMCMQIIKAGRDPDLLTRKRCKEWLDD